MSATEIRSLNGYKLTDEIARSNIEKLRTESQQYTNTKISQLINSAPTTLDTLGEIAAAMAENATVVEALDAAIGQKAGKDYVDEAIANFPKGEPDWNAKEGEEGYIKNRTHWEESEVIVTFDGVFSEEDLLPEELTNNFGNMVRVGEHISLGLDSSAQFTISPAILISNTGKKFTGQIVSFKGNDTVDILYYIDEITRRDTPLGFSIKETFVAENVEESITFKEGLYLSYEEDFYYTEIRKLKIQQIDKKFLPIESADWYSSPKTETNYIKNRTHYEDVNKYSFNSRNRDNYQSIVPNDSEMTFFKISENVPSLKKIEKNGQISLYMNIKSLVANEGELIPAQKSITSYEEEGYCIINCELGGFFICNDKQLLPEPLSFLSEGFWFGLSNEIFSVYGDTFEFEANLYITKSIKQLDEKFIPDTIARVDQIADSINVDTTLSIEGAAADAKATGNRIGAVEEIVNHMPTAYVGTEEPTDPNINVWINPEAISSNDGTWELAINQEVPESCNEVSFLHNDHGESLTKYKELIILFHLKGNNGNGSDVQAYTTGIKFGFSKDKGAWQSPFNTRMKGYDANEEKHQFMIYHMLKTPYGILNLGTYSQYNTGSMSNSYSIVGASGAHQDAQLPISANTDPTLEMTTFSNDVEFERFVIGGYQQVIGAGSIIKIWGRVE